LVVTKTDSPDPVIAGSNITYTVTITNSGPSDAQSVQFTDTVPVGTSFVSATSSQGAVSQVAGIVTGTLGTIVTGNSATVTLVFKTDANATGTTTVTNAASAFATTSDPNVANNTGTATTTVNTSADLAVTKTDTPDPVVAGNNLTYTITVTNNGPNPAQSAV